MKNSIVTSRQTPWAAFLLPCATVMKTRPTVVLLAFALSLAGVTVGEESFIGVVTTDYATGKFSVMAPDAPWAYTCDVETICPDAVARWHDGLVYIVNRTGCDNIQVLDPEQEFATVLEFSVGTGSNPQGIAFSPDGSKAYVTRQNRNEVLVVDPATGAWLDEIDLSAWADADGYEEQGDCILANDLIFVAVMRLDRDYYWLPVGDSYLVIIDPVTDTLVDVSPGQAGVQGILLAGTNPAWELNQGPDGFLYPVCVGIYGMADGGLERVDPVSLGSLGFVIDEATLGGDLGDVVIVHEQLAYAVVSDDGWSTHLKRFDPGSGGDVELVSAGGGFVFFDMELDSSGELYLCDQEFGAAGLRIYDAGTGELLAGASGNCLPPYDILIPRDEGIGVEEGMPPASLRLAAWPNPFNPRTKISWAGLPPGRVELDIFDPAGRHVARLVAGHQSGAGEVVWDARDDEGRLLPSGLYLARLEAVGFAKSLRLVLVK